MSVLSAVHSLTCIASARKAVACIGLGIDLNVSPLLVLENLATITAIGGVIGSNTLVFGSLGYSLLSDAYTYTASRMPSSIVHLFCRCSIKCPRFVPLYLLLLVEIFETLKQLIHSFLSCILLP